MCMNSTEIDLIIADLEDFYHVILIAPRGNVIEVQKKLADYWVMSRQSVKQMLSSLPYSIPESSKGAAQVLLSELEKCGMVCKLDHYGPRWLDTYNDQDIEEKLRSINNGCLSDLCIKKNSDPDSWIYEIYSGLQRLDFCYQDEDSDEEYGLHLACIRYLARRGLVE